MSEQKAPTRLSQFRSVQLLEDRILIQSWRVDDMPPGAWELVDRVTQEVFGITYADTDFHPPDNVELDDLEYEIAQEEHDAQFETDELSDDQIVAHFLPLGIDFRDDRGQPLRSTIFLSRQAEAAHKGIAGRVPSQQEAAEMDWAERLELEASNYKRSKRAG